MLTINKNSKWLDNIGHICIVLKVPEDQEDLTKMMQYQYQVEYQRKNKKVISRELKSIPMYRFLEDMKPLNDVMNKQL
jgi:glutathione peroxidase-family protein